MGTCYTTEECENASGEASGSCAEGYGVCCTFSVNCGGRSSQNNTVFMSNNPEEGECSATICPIDDTISQLRLDFTTFTIADPSTSTVAAFNLERGAVDNGKSANAIAHSTMGQCITDSFVVTAPGSPGSDVLCGTNSGTHLYIDASDNCNTLMFLLGTIGGTEPKWSITVRQYAKDHPNLAPTGCDQYHFDIDDTAGSDPTSTGIVSSFNFNDGNGVHLANQDQTICIRRESGMTRVCFSQAHGMVTNDFAVSTGGPMGSTAASALIGQFNLAGQMAAAGTMGGFCGNYGTDGKGIDFDYVNIPRPMANIGGNFFPIVGNSNFCGKGLFAKGGPALTTAGAGTLLAGPATSSSMGSAGVLSVGVTTICSTSRPFRIRFVSDAGEVVLAAPMIEAAQTGFSLGYLQS